jgi:uncharacterized protein
MTDQERPIVPPEINPETEKFWAAVAEGHLSIGRCETCGEAHYYPRALCPFCLSADTRLERVSGKGSIYSYSVMRTAPIPYAIALVSLVEGPTMMTNIVDCDLHALKIGQRVQLAFSRSQSGQPVPVFKPAQ